MAIVSSCKEYFFALFVLLFVSSNLFNGIRGSKNHPNKSATKLAVINHELCKSSPKGVSSLKEVPTYSELKYDPRASLPSSFTICLSVLVMTNSLRPLFTLLGSDDQPWFSAEIERITPFDVRRFWDRVASKYAKTDTIWMFPNQWVRICLTFNTTSGLVQWAARGELVGNTTLAEKIANNAPTDLSGKVILGSVYYTLRAKWIPLSNKLTKLEIFSSALAVEKMMEYTKGG